jgi:hypothetical protein
VAVRNFCHFLAVTRVSFLHARASLVSLQGYFGGDEMDRRRERRVDAVLSVRIWGMDANELPFAQHARVRNISSKGAVIEGIVRPVNPGEVLHVQFGEETASFRVVWAGKARTEREGEIGLERLPAEPFIWDVNLLRCSAFAGTG